MVNFFVATANGVENVGPLAPTFNSTTQLTVALAATIGLGQGFAAVQVINTDQGFVASNLEYAQLFGDSAAGIPSLKTINGAALAATSTDPSFATDNVETVVTQGSSVILGGDGFDVSHGIAVDLFGPGGKVGPFFLNPGDPKLTSNSITIFLPASGTQSPPTGPGSFVISNKGSDGAYSKKSNAVSVAIGAKINVTSVSQAGATITVNGAGFSTLTVINFFNAQGGGVVNLGGLKTGGKPNIPLKFVNQNLFTFTTPAGAVPGASYVQALNPPFLPFTSSGTVTGGAFTLK